MQFRDLGKQYEVLKDEIDAGIRDVISNCNFILGKPVDELEQQLAAYVGVKHCVSCANGSDALQLALMAWGIGAGDAVFVPDFTYFASAGCASILGATPVFVDISDKTFNMCPKSLENAIERTITEGKLKPKVIIAVDLFGQPANYPKIRMIANQYGLKILEDAAQGFGGSIAKEKACSFGDISATSFFPAKPLGCYGDGGAIFTDSDDIDACLRSLRVHGRSPYDKYDNRIIGINSRLDTLQAAILLPKLKAFREYELDSVNRVAQLYNETLKDVVVTPTVLDGYVSCWAQYTILLPGENTRCGLQQLLKSKGVPSNIYYVRGMHRQSAYCELNYNDEMFPMTVDLAKRVLSLPMHPYLTEETVLEICELIKEHVKNNHTNA